MVDYVVNAKGEELYEITSHRAVDEYIEEICATSLETEKEYILICFKRPSSSEKGRAFLKGRNRLNNSLQFAKDKDYVLPSFVAEKKLAFASPLSQSLKKAGMEAEKLYHFEIYEKQEVTYDYSVKTKKKESDKVFLSSLAKAVCILHNKGIVHAGISPYSVGIADGKVFLGGFYNSFLSGEKAYFERNESYKPLARRGVSFYSPELLECYKLTLSTKEISWQTDIFSLGLYIHWYLTCGELPILDGKTTPWNMTHEENSVFSQRYRQTSKIVISDKIKSAVMRRFISDLLIFSCRERCCFYTAERVYFMLRNFKDEEFDITNEESGTEMASTESVADTSVTWNSFDECPLENYVWKKDKIAAFQSWRLSDDKKLVYLRKAVNDEIKQPLQTLVQLLKWIVPKTNDEEKVQETVSAKDMVEETVEKKVKETVSAKETVEETVEEKATETVEKTVDERTQKEIQIEALEIQKEEQKQRREEFRKDAIECASKYYLQIKKVLNGLFSKAEQEKYKYIVTELLPDLNSGDEEIHIDETLSGVFELLEKAKEISFQSLPVLELEESDLQGEEDVDYDKPYVLADFGGALAKVDEAFAALEDTVEQYRKRKTPDQVKAEMVAVNAGFAKEARLWLGMRFDKLIGNEEVAKLVSIDPIDNEEWIRTVQGYKQCGVEIIHIDEEIRKVGKKATRRW